MPVVVLTTFEEDEGGLSALRAGASGYLLKASSSERLCEAIRLASRGETWLEPSGRSQGRGRVRPDAADRPLLRPPEAPEPLSPRELEVLGCLAGGMSNKEIGRKLAISEGTVKNHMSQVLGKLQVLDRTQAALRARELGLL